MMLILRLKGKHNIPIFILNSDPQKPNLPFRHSNVQLLLGQTPEKESGNVNYSDHLFSEPLYHMQWVAFCFTGALLHTQKLSNLM